MTDNVTLSQAPLVVATVGDKANVQHQEVLTEFLSGGGDPLNVTTTTPLPTADENQIELLKALLIEQRITNQLLYAWLNTEVEPLESLRGLFKDYPITP